MQRSAAGRPSAKRAFGKYAGRDRDYRQRVSNHIIRGNYIGLSADARPISATRATASRFIMSREYFRRHESQRRNVISGNNSDAILINGPNAGGNTIQGKLYRHQCGRYRGSSQQQRGLVILTNNNTIGGTTPGARNYVAGNAFFGIAVVFGTGNLIQGNYVGISPSAQRFPTAPAFLSTPPTTIRSAVMLPGPATSFR